MFINAWQSGQGWWPIPGESYPSGGAVIKVLDIYKWFTPHVDLIAPDNIRIISGHSRMFVLPIPVKIIRFLSRNQY